MAPRLKMLYIAMLLLLALLAFTAEADTEIALPGIHFDRVLVWLSNERVHTCSSSTALLA